MHVLHTIDDTHALVDSIVGRAATSAVIVGAGYIGLEMADALTTRGVAVTVLEQLGQVMPTLDPEFAAPLAEHLRAHGVKVHDGATVVAITPDDKHRLRVDTDAGPHHGDVVLVVTGVLPTPPSYLCKPTAAYRGRSPREVQSPGQPGHARR